MNSFDITIIGGGPGGYVAAIRAAQLGLKTALVEREHLGGICLNWGCIPTKALLRSAEIFNQMKHADAYGLRADGVGFDLDKIVKRSRTISRQLNAGVGHLLKKNKVTVFEGSATLLKGTKITIEKDGKTEQGPSSDHVILATGARARTIPGLEPDGKLVWSYKEALVPDVMPESLLVIGSGAIGIEFASFYRTLGAKVTVVELMAQIMPFEDIEISAIARKSMEKQGMKFLTNAKVKALRRGSKTVTVIVEQGGKEQEIVVDRVISAVGVSPNVEGIGLEHAGVKLDSSGFIETDEYCRTSAKGIYAIGDVAGAPCLAHKASHEGMICVEKIAGENNVHPLVKTQIPGCIYCNPQVASVGLTEAAAKEMGFDIKVGRFPFIGNGKAIALGEPEGLVKTIFDAATGELLGAHMVGAEVTELIQGFGLANTLEATAEDLIHTVFPHPTLSEMMHESVLNAFGRAIHF
jgi:dihydrolipoamide dehydrogenase